MLNRRSSQITTMLTPLYASIVRFTVYKHLLVYFPMAKRLVIKEYKSINGRSPALASFLSLKLNLPLLPEQGKKPNLGNDK